MNIDIVVIKGMKRAGTNYLQRLVSRSFDDVAAIPFLKHYAPSHEVWNGKINEFYSWAPGYSEDCKLAIIVKNPFAYYLSYSITYEGGIDEVIEKWNSDNQYFLSLKEKKPSLVALFNYIDLLKNPHNQLQKLEEKLSYGQLKKDPGFEQTTRITPQGKRNRGESFDREYYTEHRYMNELSQNEIQKIRKLSSDEICEAVSFNRA